MAVQHIRFSTLSGFASADESFAAYHDLYAPVADVVRQADRFSVELEAHRLGQMIVFDRRLAGVSHLRETKRVLRNAYDHFTVQLCLSGSFRIETDAGSRVVDPGELALVDMTRWMRTDAPRVRMLTMSVPRERIVAAIGDADRLHGTVLPVDRAALLKDFTLGILGDARSFASDIRDKIDRVSTDLLAIGLGDRGALVPGPDDPGSTIVVRNRARRFIDANLGCTPADVARAVGRSRSSLYRDFEAVGGIAAYIQTRRLRRLRDLLVAAPESHRIAHLVWDAGFTSTETAARAFKTRFGVTPRDFRASRLRHAPEALPTVLADWWEAFR